MFVTLAFLALLIEAMVGYPDWLMYAIGHPVTWMGKLIDRLDDILNDESRSDASRRTAACSRRRAAAEERSGSPRRPTTPRVACRG